MSFFLDVPAGKIAAVVTSLEMRARPALRPERPGGSLMLHHVAKPDLAWFRTLFRRVGENWIWFARLRMDDAALAAIIHDPQIEVHVLSPARTRPACSSSISVSPMRASSATSAWHRHSSAPAPGAG